MTFTEICDQAMQLPAGEQAQLADLLLDNISQSPNTIRNEQHLEELLLEAIDSPRTRLTREYWQEKRQVLVKRIAATK